ncbi:MAG TPA: SRPBCC family protein [Longimicrobium sp.]|nr:SRPBCC family protein [Longimicrobium sp.]
MKDDAVRHAVSVPVPPADAFAAFTGRMAEWWPREYTWAVDALAAVAMEPRAGGRWYERDVRGAEQTWGEVRVWDPPRRVVLSWGISPTRQPEPDAAHASEIEVRFDAVDGDATRVQVEHRDFARHGADVAADYRAGMDSPAGWPTILARFAAVFA